MNHAPWFIHPRSPLYTVNQKGSNKHVAMVSCYKALVSDEAENLANARLIAAAADPVTLRQLRELREGIQGHGWGEQDGEGPYVPYEVAVALLKENSRLCARIARLQRRATTGGR